MMPSADAGLDLAALSLGDAPADFLDLLALPRSLALDILARLPVDTRLRSVEVNRAWRALLADTSLWKRLDVGGARFRVSCDVARFSPLLFRAAVAKAGGQLHYLDLKGRRVHDDDDEPLDTSWLLFSVLHAVVVANAATLVELRLLNSLLNVDKLTTLCRSAPNLMFFESDAWCKSVNEVNTLLLKQEPFSHLQLTQLCLSGAPELTDDVAVFSFAKQLIDHGHTLTGLTFYYAPLDTAAAMGAIVDAAISLRLSRLSLEFCHATPATIPALTRLVAAGWLRILRISNVGMLFDEGADATRLFCNAVRTPSLTFCDMLGVGHGNELDELAATVSFVHVYE